MRTAFITHSACAEHDTGLGHPECASRLSAINDRLMSAHLYDFLRHYDAEEVSQQQLLRVHTQEYLDKVEQTIPEQGYANLDPDTIVSPHSLTAARHAAGAVVQAVDLLFNSDIQNAFCSVRPPGHHAEDEKAMGFCLYNNIAVGAAHALEKYNLERVAIIDFDVHQGNGTEQIFMHDERVMFCSTFQHPLYPYTPLLPKTHRMISIPLEATAKSAEFRKAVNDYWIFALENFKPELIFISAGFDAHQDDDMSGVSLTDDDYKWVTEIIQEQAQKHANGRIISSLEGGYELHSLARSVEKHVRVLMNLH